MRISALLFRRVGDSLLATPALRAIKHQHPQAVVSVVAEPHVARVFEGNPSVANIIVVKKAPSIFKLAAAARQAGPPDITLDFLSDPRSAIACLLSGAGRRVGFDYRGRKWAYTTRVALQDSSHPVYSAMHKLGLARALDADTTDLATEFYLNSDDREFAAAAWNERGWDDSTSVTAFFVNSRREYKRWPIDQFCDVIRRLQEEGTTTPLVLVTPGDESAAAEIRARSRVHATHVLPVNRIGRLGAVIERCRLLVGNDGGPKHVAVALGIPTVTLFGADPWTYWTPPDDPRHVAIAPQPNNDPSPMRVSDVSADAVYDTTIRLLAATRP